MREKNLVSEPLGTAAKRGRQGVMKALAAAWISVAASQASPADAGREQAIRIVTRIQRADYEGDRAALKRLYGDLSPFIGNQEFGARVRYWRGFALWRRAINGFNDKVEATELQEDLKRAIDEFEEAARKDPAFVDARIGALSCVGLIGYSVSQSQMEPARLQELITQGRQLWRETEAAAPGHPRFQWVIGPNLWNTPVERGGGQAKAMEGYDRGLEAIRKAKAAVNDPLEPSWGEPELLMSLAWSNLNRSTPDLNAAEQYARSALQLVPNWHYVRDILMPQIREARLKWI